MTVKGQISREPETCFVRGSQTEDVCGYKIKENKIAKRWEGYLNKTKT